jgi:hypothetical protein
MIPLVHAERIPCAFELASQSVVLEGIDLPNLLPSQLAKPQHALLLSVHEDVLSAARSINKTSPMHAVLSRKSRNGEEERSGTRLASVECGRTGKIRIIRWALKRCLRAAFELVQVEAGLHTRDLYWCCKAVEEHIGTTLLRISEQHGPEMGEHIDRVLKRFEKRALECWVGGDLVGMNGDMAFDPGAGERARTAQLGKAEGVVQELWALLEVYVRCSELTAREMSDAMTRAVEMARALDNLALALMTTVPSWWRPQASRCTSTESDEIKRIFSILPLRLGFRARFGVRTWPLMDRGWPSGLQEWSHTVMKPAVALLLHSYAAHLARRGLLQASIRDCELPSFCLPITERVRELQWTNAQDHEAALKLLECLTDDPVAAACCEPVVLRGAANEWAAVREWSVDRLVLRGGLMQGSARIAPGPEFPFVMPAHAAALSEIAGEAAAPSAVRDVRSCQ